MCRFHPKQPLAQTAHKMRTSEGPGIIIYIYIYLFGSPKKTHTHSPILRFEASLANLAREAGQSVLPPAQPPIASRGPGAPVKRKSSGSDRAAGNGIHPSDTTERASQRLTPHIKGGESVWDQGVYPHFCDTRESPPFIWGG